MQLPARRYFWGGWSRVPVRTESGACPSHSSSPTLKARRRRYTRQRPLDVNRWSCSHVAQWLGEQRWHWSELSQYQSRICAVGVDGATLYFVDEEDLEKDLQVWCACICLVHRLCRCLCPNVNALEECSFRQPVLVSCLALLCPSERRKYYYKAQFDEKSSSKTARSMPKSVPCRVTRA